MCFFDYKNYKKTSLKDEQCPKLAPKFHAPYTVLKRVGLMDY
jgi:hypothetical protein